jgi:hypothetical protein
MTYHNRPKHKGTHAEYVARSEARELAASVRRRAEAVCCERCNAKPDEHCLTESGRVCWPHSEREARSNGLHRTPRVGQYTWGDVRVAYSDRELVTLARVLDDEEFERITGKVKP